MKQISLILVLLLIIAALLIGCESPATQPGPTFFRQDAAAETTEDKAYPNYTLEELMAVVQDAQKVYSPFQCKELLAGRIPFPPHVLEEIKKHIDAERLEALADGQAQAEALENDILAAVLYLYEVPLLDLAPPSVGVVQRTPGYKLVGSNALFSYIEIKEDNTYAAANPDTITHSLVTGQDADMMLSGFGLEQTGGADIFNHPTGITSDGGNLIVADAYNNRVLIWNNAPVDGSTSPDIVLGQESFETNYAGNGLNQLNWPMSVATDGTRLYVADTNNNRVLVWNSMPSKSGQPADFELSVFTDNLQDPDAQMLRWPWCVWTNGEKLIITSTERSGVYIWNELPRDGKDYPDLSIRLEDMGTPRSIACDGNMLLIGDHNLRTPEGEKSANMVWTEFPTRNDEPYDFYIGDGVYFGNMITKDGKYIAVHGNQGILLIYDGIPAAPDAQPSKILGTNDLTDNENYYYVGGDGSGLTMVGDRLYASLYNGNKIIMFHQVPDSQEDWPDAVIGADTSTRNTLIQHGIITNPNPCTDGTHLVVTSGFDSKIYIWKLIPDQDGVMADVIFTLQDPDFQNINDNALYEGTLIAAARRGILVWYELPLNGEEPDAVFTGRIGNILFDDLSGVALDDKYLYVSDAGAGFIYAWEGIPSPDDDPALSIPLQEPGILNSANGYLVAASRMDHSLYIYAVDDLANGNYAPMRVPSEGVHIFNLVSEGFIDENGRLFATDSEKVQIWNSIDDAANGKEADIVLGKGSDSYELDIHTIGSNSLFMPRFIDYDGKYLWVGEYKFSNRLLRFSGE